VTVPAVTCSGEIKRASLLIELSVKSLVFKSAEVDGKNAVFDRLKKLRIA
jgi:hypothetical protein